jgi:hypothetical protein
VARGERNRGDYMWQAIATNWRVIHREHHPARVEDRIAMRRIGPRWSDPNGTASPIA